MDQNPEKKSINLDVDDKKKSRMSVLFDQSQRSFGRASCTSRMKVRKQSYGFSAVGGIRHPDRWGQLGQEYKRPMLSYLNTYQLEPRVKFKPILVTKAIDVTLDHCFTKHKYNVQASPSLALQISGDLLKTVKGMKFDRYRILSVVTIGQKRAQSYVNAVAFLWDHARDNYVNVQREEHTCFIQLPADLKRPVLVYLNTYQLNPYVKFDPVPVEKAANTLLDEYFTDYKYSAHESPTLALTLSGLLMRAVKAMNFNRYRIIAVVTIGQKRAQSYVNAIAFLWDSQRDGYMNVHREVHTAFIQMTVFAIYLD